MKKELRIKAKRHEREVSWHFRDLPGTVHGSTLSSKEQWLLWWWQTSRNMIHGHMPPWKTLWTAFILIHTQACARTCHATLRPITKRNNIIGQQKRPRPETPRFDTNVQICQVIELHVEGKALDGVKKNAASRDSKLSPFSILVAINVKFFFIIKREIYYFPPNRFILNCL